MRDELDRGVERVFEGSDLLAIILRSYYTASKSYFFSQQEYSQQLGFITYPAGGVIKAHVHKPLSRSVIDTQEVLFVKKGRMIVNFYDKDRNIIHSSGVGTGDTIFLVSGGHGFTMIEDTEIIEVKQGPYLNREQDKEIF